MANFRLLRRPLSVWLYLMRSGRLYNKQNQRDSSTESTNMDDQVEIENEPDGRYSGLYQRDADNCHVSGHSEEVNFAWVVSRLILTAVLQQDCVFLSLY